MTDYQFHSIVGFLVGILVLVFFGVIIILDELENVRKMKEDDHEH